MHRKIREISIQLAVLGAPSLGKKKPFIFISVKACWSEFYYFEFTKMLIIKYSYFHQDNDTSHIQNEYLWSGVKVIKIAPPWPSSSVGWSIAPRDCGFHSRLGHRPRLCFWSSLRTHPGGNKLMLLSPIHASLPRSLHKPNLKTWKPDKKWPTIQDCSSVKNSTRYNRIQTCSSLSTGIASAPLPKTLGQSKRTRQIFRCSRPR